MIAYAQPDERAGLLSAYFVEGYLAFSIPALAAGFLAPVVGLTRTADFYGVGVILLAVSTLIVNCRAKTFEVAVLLDEILRSAKERDQKTMA